MLGRRRLEDPPELGEVWGAAAQDRGDLPRPVVVDVRHRRSELPLLRGEGLRALVELLGSRLEPLLRRRQLLQPEDGEQRVVEVGRPSQEHRAELGVRQERAEGLQRLLPAEPVDRLPRVAWPLVPARRRLDVGAAPRPFDLGGAGFPVDSELDGDRRIAVRQVEVAPALAPDGTASGPPGVVTGQRDLEGLGEAGLARAVPADDEREARARLESQRCVGADPAEARHPDRREVRPRDVDGRAVHRRGTLAVQDTVECLLQLGLALEGSQHEQLRGLRQRRLVDPLEDEVEQRGGLRADRRHVLVLVLTTRRHPMLRPPSPAPRPPVYVQRSSPTLTASRAHVRRTAAISPPGHVQPSVQRRRRRPRLGRPESAMGTSNHMTPKRTHPGMACVTLCAALTSRRRTCGGQLARAHRRPGGR